MTKNLQKSIVLLQRFTTYMRTAWALLALFPALASAAPVQITLLHTNDLHSHLKGEKLAMGAVGGIARIKTLVDRIRAEAPHTLFVDGGDWSEGNVFYNMGAGLETLRVIDRMGYDAIAIGNHEWLNGPDHLLDLLEQAQPKAPILAANLKLKNYHRADDWRRHVRPYVIREIGDARIAFIGMTTKEFIYEDMIKPIEIKGPLGYARAISKYLKEKEEVDAVIVISHNSLPINRAILKRAPDVDLVIGAHDHAKVTRPIVVARDKRNPAWVVESGAHGRYLGQVELKVTPRAELRKKHRKRNVELLSFRLTQIDPAIPDDPEIAAQVARIERQIEDRYGPEFQEVIGESEIELSSQGVETQLGNLLTDAYRAETGAEIAFDQSGMVYGTIHEGPIRTVDVYNANPAVYNKDTGKSWTLKVLPMRGGVLRTVLSILFSIKKVAQHAPLNISGLEITFNPKFNLFWTIEAVGLPYLMARYHTDWFHFPKFLQEMFRKAFERDELEIVGNILVNGQPLETQRMYTVAIGGGIAEALRYLNSRIPGFVPMDGMIETGKEDWRVLRDHIRRLSPLTAEKLPIGQRVRTRAPDLGIFYHEIRSSSVQRLPHAAQARISAIIRNYGATRTPEGSRVHILINRNGTDYSVDPAFVEGGLSRTIRPLEPGESVEVVWNNVMIPEVSNGTYPVTVRIAGNAQESNSVNDQATRFFRF